MNNTYELFVGKCLLFNQLAGKNGIPTKQALKEQLELIREELQETIDDLEEGNWTGVLDGYADIAVTWAGFGSQLDNLRFDTKGALLETADNNLTKFISEDSKDASECLDATLKMYKDKGETVTYEHNDTFGCFVIKDLNNKVKKPCGFVSNDVSKFVPKGFNL